MKKIKFTYEQFYELEKQQTIRDLAYKIANDLVFLASICSRKDGEEMMNYAKGLDVLRDNTIKRIDKIIDWE